MAMRFRFSVRALLLLVLLTAVCTAMAVHYYSLVVRQRTAVKTATSSINTLLNEPSVQFTYDNPPDDGLMGWVANQFGTDFTSKIIEAKVSRSEFRQDLSWLPKLEHIRHLEFDHSAAVTTLNPVSTLLELEVLIVYADDMFDQQSFELVCQNCDLRKLIFEQDQINSLEPIAFLENLEELVWSSGFESSPRLELAPIGNLYQLKRLVLYLHHTDYSFEFLASLTNLEDLIIHVAYNVDVDQLIALLPRNCKHDIKRFK